MPEAAKESDHWCNEWEYFEMECLSHSVLWCQKCRFCCPECAREEGIHSDRKTPFRG